MSNIVICHYRVKSGNEDKFEGLLSQHWPTLQRLGLVTNERSQTYRGAEQDNGRPIYFEIFEWLEGADERAHAHPEVMAVWERMDQLCEKRGDKPNMEFPHVKVLNG